VNLAVVSARLTGLISAGIDDSSRLHFEFDVAPLSEGPILRGFVIVDDTDAEIDEPPALSDLREVGA
jgi:hypothetical protein